MAEGLHKELMGPTLDLETTRPDEPEQWGTYPVFKLPKVSDNQKWPSSVKMDPEWYILERFEPGPAWEKPEGLVSTVISSLSRRGSRDPELSCREKNSGLGRIAIFDASYVCYSAV